MKLAAILLATALCAMAPAQAAPNAAIQSEPDAATQARMLRLAAELRCLVCQNQSIADSNADLALDLRRQIYEQIAAGRSDGEIVEYMVNRYGDFVRYKPPLKATTVLLWAGPAGLALLGFGLLGWTLRERRRRGAAEPPLTDEESHAAERLLHGSGEDRA